MYKVTKYPHGTFCWADCNSTDPEKAKKFYIDLMGWDHEDMPMGEGMVYTMFKLDGEDVAALSGMSPEQIEMGIPSNWTNYIDVDDVDALVEPVKAHGGAVLVGPFDVFDNGRMMMVQDPTGARVAFWQAKSHIGASIVNTVGALAWNELYTHDVAKAQAFYSAVFGWTFEKDATGYNTIKNNGRYAGGMLQSEGEDAPPPAWMPYFNVADIEKTVAKAQALGGTVHVPPTPAGETGIFAVIADPAGAVATYMQMKQVDPWEDPT